MLLIGTDLDRPVTKIKLDNSYWFPILWKYICCTTNTVGCKPRFPTYKNIGELRNKEERILKTPYTVNFCSQQICTNTRKVSHKHENRYKNDANKWLVLPTNSNYKILGSHNMDSTVDYYYFSIKRPDCPIWSAHIPSTKPLLSKEIGKVFKKKMRWSVRELHM